MPTYPGALAVIISGVVDFFLLPDRWARRYGALGFLTGLPTTVAVAVLRPVYAALVLADRILTGTYNAAAQRLDPLGQRWPQVNTFDPLLSMSNTHHHTVKFLEAEISSIELAPQRVHALLRATERARGARAAYLTAARQGGWGAGGLTHMQGYAVVHAFATALERGRLSSAIGGNLGLPPEAVSRLAGDVRGCGAAWSKCPLGSAPARLLRLLRARLVSLGSPALPVRGPGHWVPSHCLG